MSERGAKALRGGGGVESIRTPLTGPLASSVLTPVIQRTRQRQLQRTCFIPGILLGGPAPQPPWYKASQGSK